MRSDRAISPASRVRSGPAHFRFPTITGRIRSSAPSGGTTRATSRPPRAATWDSSSRSSGPRWRRLIAAPRRRRIRVESEPALPRPLRPDRHCRGPLPRGEPAEPRGPRAQRRPRAALPCLARGLVRGERRGRRLSRAPPRGRRRRRHRPRPRERQARRPAGRPRMEREGARAGQCVVLLLLHAHARARDRARGRGVARRLRPRLDGSRVEHERAGPGSRRLGLARAPARRRARRHGLSAPPPRRRAGPAQRGNAHRGRRQHATAGAGGRDARGARSLDEPGEPRALPEPLAPHHSHGRSLPSRSRRGWPLRS